MIEVVEAKAYVCDACGARLELIAENGNEHGDVFHTPLQPRYCPMCGRGLVG